ncbi:MAG: hypothetical protein LBS74_06280 [Oscillospiraceae bacterium]|jgi:uncharacterized protein YxjI|nr:hypothetical protein [Oscillospiraceae bacterium]
MAFSNFFSYNRYIVNENFALSFQENSYAIQDENGNLIGYIQEKRSTGHKIAGALIGKNMLPFHLDIVDAQGQLLLSIKRGATLFLSKIAVTDPAGNLVGYIKQKFTMMKPKFTILGSNEAEIGTITGNWTGWNFNITAMGVEVGSINKKWNGLAKEMFTTQDKYVVTINPEASFADEYMKVMIIATATTVDMVLKEQSK